MKLSIIVIGTEILIGQVTDTNSGYISRMLGADGWITTGVRVVDDNAADIRDAVETALAESDLVITTGGLGPTKDDITKGVLASIFGGGMRYDAAVAANVEEIFARRGLILNDLTRAQALVPESCRVIQNRLGTAPVMWFERNGKVLISMPGVPFETEGMMQRAVREEIRRHFSPDTVVRHHTMIVSGITESDLAQHLASWEDALPAGLHLAYLPVPGYIRLRLDGMIKTPDGTPAARDTITSLDRIFDTNLDSLRRLLGDHLLHDGDATPAEILLDLLKSRSLTMASAESCTGGNIAHAITSVPGSSDCFVGGVVSYANSVKENVLGVSAGDLAAHGAVSQPVVEQMVKGVCTLTGADCSIATSGIAGPGGGTPDKPVGTVWIAVRWPGGTDSRLCHFAGDRSRVIERATAEAILMLVRRLR